MNELFRIGIFAAAIIAGLLLGGIVPKDVVKESWRLPVAVTLILAGITLAALAWSSAP